LRTKFDELWGKGRGKERLTLQTGVISLQHAVDDVDAFCEAVSEGTSLMSKEQLWQAANSFRKANRLWNGPFLKDMKETSESQIVRAKCLNKYLELSLNWSRLFVGDNELLKALNVASDGLKENPSDEKLARQLYDIHIKSENPTKAKKVIKDYRQALIELGTSESEIKELMEVFWEE
jgi:hypothetical protein